MSDNTPQTLEEWQESMPKIPLLIKKIATLFIAFILFLTLWVVILRPLPSIIGIPLSLIITFFMMKDD